MQLRKEYQERLAKEYRYAATKMQESAEPAKKLYYFSVLFGEAQRVLNWEWNRDLALIHTVVQQAYTQINPATQTPVFGIILPIQAATVYAQLTQIASDLATYFEKEGAKDQGEKLCQILGRLAEVTFVAGGNGSYLYDKGFIKFSPSPSASEQPS